MSDRASTWLDRRIGAALTHRAAHPVPPAWHDLLGRRALAVGAGMYAAALALGAAAAVAAGTAQDRLIVLMLLAGLAGLAALTAAEVAAALRRPTLAEDAGSLAADDALRAEDARTAVTSPMPVLLAEFTALALPGETASRLASVCVVAAVLACAVSVWGEAAAAGRGRPRPTPPVTIA